MARIFDGQLWVHYGQAYVISSDNFEFYLDDAFRGQNNGLCGAAFAGVLYLLTGLHTGNVGLTLDVLDAPPPLEESWEEIVEVSFRPGSEKVFLQDWNGNCVCNIPLSQESYRVRYCARNMDRGREIDTALEDEPVVDFYYLAFWPAEPTPDVVVKQTSRDAAYWHDWVNQKP